MTRAGGVSSLYMCTKSTFLQTLRHRNFCGIFSEAYLRFGRPGFAVLKGYQRIYCRAVAADLKVLDLLSNVSDNLVLQLLIRRAFVRLADLTPRNQILDLKILLAFE
jgi:hypothetical protein